VTVWNTPLLSPKRCDKYERDLACGNKLRINTYILSQYLLQLRKLPTPKEAVFTIKLEPDLRDEFMAEANAAQHRRSPAN
jgi:hypothetical protein